MICQAPSSGQSAEATGHKLPQNAESVTGIFFVFVGFLANFLKINLQIKKNFLIGV